ncbi:MAG: chromosomal replication initiator protein DnaA [Myxococcales bacterium]|nr:chromosomal replication initiator protein DnaA [Myxococcales bacterium]USN51871.1 MAG: chromosomal replication initiator protein DnaA [Myxococcales bacterium]
MVAIKEMNEHSSDSGREQAIELLTKARAVLKRRLSFFVWQGFFEPLDALSLSEKELCLEAPTSFHRNWVMDHYMGELNAAISEVSGEDIKIEIVCSDSRPRMKPQPKAKEKIKFPKEKSLENGAYHQESNEPEKNAPLLPVKNPGIGDEAKVLPLLSNTNLNASYSFETYIQGPSNQMGYAAALAVADHPGTQFSPLFLFGGVGLGKTHLLHAIGLRAKQLNPTLKVVYLSAEQWVNSYIQAIRERQFDSFRNRYRNSCDILLIDDIQFLAGKDASQDEFFHTFNSLHEAKKQIVVTSDKYPHEISGLEERLQTRLSWGLIADIRPPEIETRIAILHKKAESLNVKLSDDVINFLATNVVNSVRELEGALVRLSACVSLTKQEMTLSQAREILAPVIKRKSAAVSWQKICEIVASHYGLRTSDLTGASRQRQIAFARQVAMSFCRLMLNMSLPEIGRAFGGRDHSTVLSSIRKVESNKEKDVSFIHTLQKLEAKISASA